MKQSEAEGPCIIPTNDSRRFFVLYLDNEHANEASLSWRTGLLVFSLNPHFTICAQGENILGLGFAERIDAYEFEEELLSRANPSEDGESISTNPAFLPHRSSIRPHINLPPHRNSQPSRSLRFSISLSAHAGGEISHNVAAKADEKSTVNRTPKAALSDRKRKGYSLPAERNFRMK